MSTVTTENATPRWLPAAELQAQGFQAGGPEIDFGMRCGERGDVRVSFAPYRDRDDGFLYAHDPATERYLVLAARTTPEQADAACRELTAHTSSPDAYLGLASLDHAGRPMPLEQARSLLLHCVDREMSAHHDYTAGGSQGSTRFGAAQAVIVQRSARAAAEQLLHDAARAMSDGAEPVVVRYRILGESGWAGRVAGTTLQSACADTRNVQDTAWRHQLEVQATSVTHGHTTVAAARVPQLEFASQRPSASANAPQMAI